MRVFHPTVVTCPQQCSNGGECFRYDGGPYSIYGCDCQDDYVGMFCDFRSCEFVATVNCNTKTLVSLSQAMHCHVFLCRWRTLFERRDMQQWLRLLRVSLWLLRAVLWDKWVGSGAGGNNGHSVETCVLLDCISFTCMTLLHSTLSLLAPTQCTACTVLCRPCEYKWGARLLSLAFNPVVIICWHGYHCHELLPYNWNTQQ